MSADSNPFAKSPATPVNRHYVQEILLGLLPLLLSGQILIGVALTAKALEGDADFRQLYAAGYMVRTGHAHELYDYHSQIRFQAATVPNSEPFLPFIRPAFQALIFVPFSGLGYRSAYLAFFALNLILLFATYGMLRTNLANFALRWRWFPLCFFLSFLPLSIALIQGQDTMILLAILVLSFRLLSLRRDFLAGTVLALGLFKPQIVLIMAVLFLFWRYWKLLFGFGLMGASLALISVCVTGFQQAGAFLRLIWGVGGAANVFDSHQALLRVNFMPNLRGLLFGLLGTSLPNPYLRGVTFALSAALFLFLIFRWRSTPPPDEAFKIATLTSVVLSYYLLIHDLSIAIPSLTLIMNRSFQRDLDPSVRARCETWAALAASVAPASMLWGIEHLYLLSVPFIALLFLTIPLPPSKLSGRGFIDIPEPSRGLG